MTSPAESADQRRFTAELERNHDHNARMNLLDGLFFAVGGSCVLPAIVIPSFLNHYTTNKFILNLPVFISNIMFAVLPFLTSFVAGKFHRKKPVMNAIAVFHRIAWIPVLASVFFLGDKPKLLLPVFLACYAVFYAFWGVSVTFWREMMGRVLHPSRQNSAFGMREAVGNIAGFLAGFGVMAILARVAFPGNFLVLFSIFFVLFGICLLWLFQFKEASWGATHHESPARHLRTLLALPKNDPVFRWFVVFILFSYGSLFTGSLFTTIGLDRFGATVGADRLTGIMTIVSLFSNSVFALVLGRVSDRWGKFWAYLPGIVVSVLLPLWAIVATGPVGYLGIFLLLGSMNVSWFIELFATLNFAPPEKRHLYIAYVSLVKVVPILVYINLGGWLAQHVSPYLTLAISSVFCLAGLAVLVFKLRPHWQTAAAAAPKQVSVPDTAG